VYFAKLTNWSLIISFVRFQPDSPASGEILRVKQCNSKSTVPLLVEYTPHAIASDKPLLYRFALPTANHVPLPVHRIMVQVQSSWFPLHDRSPQTFVPNIFWAKPEDYRKAVQRVYHAPAQASFVELPVAQSP